MRRARTAYVPAKERGLKINIHGISDVAKPAAAAAAAAAADGAAAADAEPGGMAIGCAPCPDASASRSSHETSQDVAAAHEMATAVVNAVLGGEATFKQAYAIVVHSGFIGALQTLFVMPLNYVRESMSSATSLLAFLPMIDEKSFFGMLCGSIDFFRIWSTLSLAIGLAVLYKRRTAPIAWSLLAVYGIIILAIAGVRAALSGA